MSIRRLKKVIYTVIASILIYGSINSQHLKELSILPVHFFKEEKNIDLEKATIERIVDGDTLKIKIGDESYKVRLIGIDAPESVNPDKSKNTSEGKKASEYVKSILTVGQTIYLQKDQSNTDKYGRLLRYIWLDIPEDVESTKEIKKKMLNAVILDAGYAKAVGYKPDTRYQSVFSDLEKAAKNKRRGIWK